MNIDISAKEYLSLLDILHIADVVMSGHRREEDGRTGQHRTLIQKLYSLARGEGLDRLIGYDESVHKHVPTAEFEENSPAHAMIHEFVDHIFWDELISRLSVRDAAQIAGGSNRLDAMNDSDRQQVEGPIRRRYIGEFAANGLANLEVVERLGMGGGQPVRTSD